MRIRPIIVLLLTLSLFSCHSGKKSTSGANFVTVKDGHFMRNGKAYYFMGANYWKGQNLGSPGEGGNRDRLKRELDQMKAAGIRNLRVLALSEGPDNTPYRILPAVQDEPANLKEDMMVGLDYLLVEIHKRGMTAVMVLNNFWPWSGGMAQYLNWNGAGAIPYPPPHPGGTWDGYQKYTAQFYTNQKALAQCNEAMRKVITRKNTINGKNYVDDPAIMAWELCNEPRGINNEEAMNLWIDNSAALIKSLDRNHLVTTGAEGYTSAPEFSGTNFIRMHDGPNIDYATAHIWIQNWGWYDPAKHAETYEGAKAKMLAYLDRHVQESRQLGKPFVLEEFGIMKDGGNFDPATTTVNRDIYYSAVFEAVLDQMKLGQASGVNFWAWGGEGRPKKPGTMWAKGDELTGDPPHEPQGWYSVYNTDKTTQAVIKEYSAKIRELNK
jgi:mannan endo-1,4-beta-mannosidase